MLIPVRNFVLFNGKVYGKLQYTTKTSGIQSRNALGVGERYHACLDQVYRRVQTEHNNMDIK